MKKVTSALALAALIGSPAAFAQVEFGGYAEFNAYNVRDGQADQDSDRSSGMQQLIRLQGAFESEGGVEVHTRLNLFNDRWTGNDSGVETEDENPFSSRDHRNVELDLGYISLPIGIGRMNIGRQASSWNHNFTASDDRRDRIGFVIPLGGGHVFAPSYDRRQAPEEVDASEDGNQFNFAVLGPITSSANYGVLLTHWEASGSGHGSGSNAPYLTMGSHLLAPYVAGESGNFSYKIGGHYLTGGRGSGFTEDTQGGYLKAGMQLTPEFLLEGQIAHTNGGALVAGGFDTYSSLINSSPDHNESPTSIAALSLGQFGTEYTEDFSRTLAAVRGTYEAMDWTFKGAVGWVNYEGAPIGVGTELAATGSLPSATPPEVAGARAAADAAADVDEDVVFVDLQAHYALTPSTTIYATAGYAATGDLSQAQGSQGSRDKDTYATSLNVETQF